MNARDLITSALRTIGIIASGETPAASEMQDGLSALNMMIKSWSTQNLALFTMKREVFELQAGKGQYTIGIGGDFDTARPMHVLGSAWGNLIKTPIYEDVEVPGIPTPEEPDPPPTIEQQLVGYALSSDFETPMCILNYQDWMAIQLKETQSSIPTQIYVHNEEPLEKLSFWPVPSENCGLVLYSKKEISQFPDLDEEIDLPAGYEEAIKYNLVLRLALEFGREISPRIDKLASDSISNIKRKNTKTAKMISDAVDFNYSGESTFMRIYGGR